MLSFEVYVLRIFQGLADHISVPFFTKSRLPEQKDELVKGIQQIIDEMPEEQLRLYRDQNPIM